MSNEKYYFCCNKICMTNYECRAGIRLLNTPARLYATKEDYVNGSDDCITSMTVKNTGARIEVKGKVEYMKEDDCPYRDERDEYMWGVCKELIKEAKNLKRG